MDEAQFRARLEADGYQTVRVAEWAANTVNDTHAHDFTACGLILSGEFTLEAEGVTRELGPGDVFTVAAGTTHVERTGPAGVRFVVGRKT